MREPDNCQLCHGASGGVKGNENRRPDGTVVCDYCDCRVHDGSWLVIRHGARSTDRWRIAFRGKESKARLKYQKIAEQLRQGGVELVSPERREEHTSAPRLRTRW